MNKLCIVLLVCSFAAAGFDYHTAKELYREGKYQEAYSIFSYVEAHQPPLKAYTQYYKALSALKLGVTTNTLTYLQTVTTNTPFSADIRNIRIDLMQRFDQTLLPIDIYARGLELFEHGYFEESILWLAQVTRNAACGQAAQIYIGRAHIIRGRYKQAQSLFESLPEGDATYFLGLIALRREQTALARQYFTRVYEQYPQSPYAASALYNTATKLQYSGQEQQALLLRLIEQYPLSELFGGAAWSVAYREYAAGRYANAYDLFIKAVRASPRNAASDQLLYWAAKCLEHEGKREEAFDIYERVVQEYPMRYYGFRAAQRIGVKPWLPHGKGGVDPKYSATINLLLAQGEYEDALEELMTAKHTAVEASVVDLHYIQSEVASKLDRYPESIRGAIAYIQAADADLSLYKLPRVVWEYAYPLGYKTEVRAAAKKYGVDPYLVHALIREESLYQEKALSHANAYGLMQIIASTAAAVAQRFEFKEYTTTANLHDAPLNIRMGTAYLSTLLKRFDQDPYLALSAYNAGPSITLYWKNKRPQADLDEFIENIPYNETRNYIKRVMKSYWSYTLIYGRAS